jgi:hypothetical protein
LALGQAAGVSQGDEFLFNAHRLQLCLDSSGKIGIVLRASIDGSNAALGERHDYRPFFGFLNSARTAVRHDERDFSQPRVCVASRAPSEPIPRTGIKDERIPRRQETESRLRMRTLQSRGWCVGHVAEQ